MKLSAYWSVKVGLIYGYLSEMPKNPFNGKITVAVLNESVDIDSAASGNFGWLHKPSTKQLKIDSIGTDSEGEDGISEGED